MRLLITTQAVDLDDPVLGFFHSWILALSKHCEQVHVICLKEGRHALPANVTIHSLGKNSFQGLPLDSKGNPWIARTRYVWRFYKYIWALRKEYDAVFVHMNQEYALLGGKFWRALGKRVVLWRNHKMGSVWTHIAGFFAHTVCYTSPEAYVAKFRNARQMPVGIDTAFFTPSAKSAAQGTILFLGRLDAVKNPGVFLRAMGILRRDGSSVHADIYGDPTPGREDFARKLKADFASLKRVSFHTAVRNEETPAIYNVHSIYVNLTPSGSFDKTIGEAAASGCVVVVGNDALRGVVPDELLVDVNSADSVASGIKSALEMDTRAREVLSKKLRAYAVENYSLTLLVTRLMALFAKRP